MILYQWIYHAEPISPSKSPNPLSNSDEALGTTSNSSGEFLSNPVPSILISDSIGNRIQQVFATMLHRSESPESVHSNSGSDSNLRHGSPPLDQPSPSSTATRIPVNSVAGAVPLLRDAWRATTSGSHSATSNRSSPPIFSALLIRRGTRGSTHFQRLEKLGPFSSDARSPTQPYSPSPLHSLFPLHSPFPDPFSQESHRHGHLGPVDPIPPPIPAGSTSILPSAERFRNPASS